MNYTLRKSKEEMEKKYRFIGKTIYFPEKKIVCIGDLHLGYENMLYVEGSIMFPLEQIKETINNLKETFDYYERENIDIKKIILLGDIKHYFKYDREEKFGFLEILNFLRNYAEEENIILIRGNHDKIDMGKKFFDFYICDEIIFMHGHKSFYEIGDKKIRIVVIGHIHPSIVLNDSKIGGVKREKYKCFLVGEYKNKEIIVAPSFLGFSEGSEILDYRKKFAIVSKNNLKNFSVYAVGKGIKVFDVGKLKEIL